MSERSLPGEWADFVFFSQGEPAGNFVPSSILCVIGQQDILLLFHFMPRNNCAGASLPAEGFDAFVSQDRFRHDNKREYKILRAAMKDQT